MDEKKRRGGPGGPRKKISDPNCKTMSVEDAGRRYFNLGRSASYEACRRGEIPFIQIGKSWRVPIVALERMLEEARAMPREST
jgi:excisionase family DNA binding protein